MPTVELTKSQCNNIAIFIEENIFNVIRDDTEIDNIRWLIDVLDAYKILKESGKGAEEDE